METNKSYNETIKKRQAKNKQALIAIFKEMPIIEVAVKRVGISRDTYYRWKQDDKAFFQQSEDAVSQGIEFINDMSESQLITLIKEKKMPAITLWLRHNNPKYASKTDIATKTTPIEELTTEQKATVEQALRLANLVQEYPLLTTLENKYGRKK